MSPDHGFTIRHSQLGMFIEPCFEKWLPEPVNTLKDAQSEPEKFVENWPFRVFGF